MPAGGDGGLSVSTLSALACWAGQTALTLRTTPKTVTAAEAINLLQVSQALRELIRLRDTQEKTERDLVNLQVFATDVMVALDDPLESDGGKVAAVKAAVRNAGLRKGAR